MSSNDLSLFCEVRLAHLHVQVYKIIRLKHENVHVQVYKITRSKHENVYVPYVYSLIPPLFSGVTKPGHPGACTPASRGFAPPLQVCLSVICINCTVVDHKLGG